MGRRDKYVCPVRQDPTVGCRGSNKDEVSMRFLCWVSKKPEGSCKHRKYIRFNGRNNIAGIY